MVASLMRSESAMAAKGPRHRQQQDRRAVFAPMSFELSERVRKRLGATGKEMAAYIGVTSQTYRRRAQQGELVGAESAKVEMLDALLRLGARVLGDEERAGAWLASPILSLEGRRPIELLDSVTGYERVRNKLLQIEYGTF